MGTTAKSMARILVVDDDEDILTAARLLLKNHFAVVRTERGTARLAELASSRHYDVVLLDMNFAVGAETGEEGLSWLGRIRKADPAIGVVLITAHGDIATAVEAMKRGATDFVVKPWDNDRLVGTLKAAAETMKSASRAPFRPAAGPAAGPAAAYEPVLVGASPAMTAVLDLVRRAAPSDANVLVLGENGTGKELVARELHRQSHRADKVFLSVDLGSVAANLFESELFGHRKGAFTDAREDRIGRFQAAAGGTLFLDEIGNLPLSLQAKLLTVIERREVTPVGANKPIQVDVRLICATNLTARQLADPAIFRPDLLYRINTVEITLPPLRARADDIPALTEHFAALYARKYNMAEKRIAPAAIAQLKAHAWPGNIRSLRHVVERAVILAQGSTLEPADFPLPQDDETASTAQPAAAPAQLHLGDLERQAVERALQKHGGNVSQAAQELGLTRASLYRRLEKYGL